MKKSTKLIKSIVDYKEFLEELNVHFIGKDAIERASYELLVMTCETLINSENLKISQSFIRAASAVNWCIEKERGGRADGFVQDIIRAYIADDGVVFVDKYFGNVKNLLHSLLLLDNAPDNEKTESCVNGLIDMARRFYYMDTLKGDYKSTADAIQERTLIMFLGNEQITKTVLPYLLTPSIGPSTQATGKGGW